MGDSALSSSRTLWQGAFFIHQVLGLISNKNPFRSRRPLPLRLESRRASILSLSDYESNFGLQQPQVDWADDLDVLDDLVDLDDLDVLDDLDNVGLQHSQADLPLHPPSYQDLSGLPAYQDAFQVNDEQ